MFTSVNFLKYIGDRIQFYNELRTFVIQPEHLSSPIRIDKSFMDKLNSNFQKFLERRLEPVKFTNQENKEYKELIKKIFPETEEIFNHKDPTIYWFKINYSNGLTNQKIIRHYSSVKDNEKGWWTQVNNSRRNSKTDILYLGKIESAFQNRFIQHIGLGHEFTSSLKLQRWMPSLDGMSLTFQFLKLNKKWKRYTEDIEKVLWDAAEPLLGAIPKIKGAETVDIGGKQNI